MRGMKTDNVIIKKL